MVGCTAGASSKLLFSIVAHTLYPASAVLCLYFAIRARCYTSALAPCRMQEPFPPHPFLFLPFSHPSLSLSLSFSLHVHTPLSLLHTVDLDAAAVTGAAAAAARSYVDRFDAGCCWHRCCYWARLELSSGENEIVRHARLVVLSAVDGWATTSCQPRSAKAYFYRNIDRSTGNRMFRLTWHSDDLLRGAGINES